MGQIIDARASKFALFAVRCTAAPKRDTLYCSGMCMKLALLLGLLSALALGAADYLMQATGRALGVWRSLFYAELIAFGLLSIWLVIGLVGGHISISTEPQAWMAALISGCILLVSASLLSRGLITGALEVVAPVAASYGALTAILSAAVGERLPRNAVVGLLLTLVGVIVVAVPPGGIRRLRGHVGASGLGWGVGAAIGYGLGFWLQGIYAVPLLGAVVPVWLAFGVGVVVLGLLSQPLHVSLGTPPRSTIWPLVALGASSVGGFLMLTIGAVAGHTSIVVILSSMASAVTVLLGRILEGTKVMAYQWLAIGVIVSGLACIRG